MMARAVFRRMDDLLAIGADQSCSDSSVAKESFLPTGANTAAATRLAAATVPPRTLAPKPDRTIGTGASATGKGKKRPRGTALGAGHFTGAAAGEGDRLRAAFSGG